MQLPFFFEENLSPQSSTIFLSEETSKHCVQVLRMKEGEQLQLTDGKGNLFTSAIIKADKKNCEVKIEETSFKEQVSKQISMAVSLLKNANRFEWFLEKATEIGVSEIAPILCKRTERTHFRLDRMKHILVSAMLQSRQVWLPVLHEPLLFEKLILSSAHQQKFIAYCDEKDKKELKNFTSSKNMQILIGPEGDFTEEEISLAIQNNYHPVSLGETRLRTETAAVVAAALLINL
jgi:16S rRNA (uracil1498-N3)-methyltransferase